MHVTKEKNVYCITRDKRIHYLGSTNHRRWHKNRKIAYEIEFTHGNIKTYTPKTEG